MVNELDLGRQAVEHIASLWEVDSDRVVETQEGFDWWPSRFRVSVRVQQHAGADRAREWRLVVDTAFLKGVDLGKAERIKNIATFSQTAPSYAWVYTPEEARKEYKLENDGRIDFSTTAYVRDDMAGWLPKFIGGMAIMQAIDAHRTADTMALILKGQMDTSGPNGRPADEHYDDMLNVGGSFFVPEGRKPSAWLDTTEFSEVAERFGRSDLCFGNGDPTGLTLETPIGTSSALIRLRTDVPHPSLGNGLLASLEFPFVKDEAATLDDCLWLNFLESRFWTDVPQMGSWHLRPADDGQFRAGHSLFVPNGLFSPGIATNIALWQFGRARWVKNTLYKNLEDLTMQKILEARFGL